MTHSIEKKLYPFSDLDLHLWHDIIQLRERVFIVEQRCLYQEVDGKDPYCHHIVFYCDNNLIAYTRIVPGTLAAQVQGGKGLPSIGRVVVKKEFRGQKMGYTLLKYAIEKTKDIHGDRSIFISAQQHLSGFYSNLGFETIGEPYLEVGIPHSPMVLL
ncbi:GNAT family N-acetyltransferase [Membranihabitans maritimus]|uniref:GNAT family N-acetyltransferase n=1 Tax=Membranihabitans maritimus TaxID=2904244 RepID=UPI001F0247EA|nr:GNAT family N-acetyltransferase [Membranihabitans maritimus]